MKQQLHNTLCSLKSTYQRNVDPDDYEVIVVENSSDDNFAPTDVSKEYGSNFRYFLRQETSQSPVPAVNFAFEQCQGQYIGLIIDGARMLSPGVIHYVKMATQVSVNSIVAVPGYHIGESEHHLTEPGYSVEFEQNLLKQAEWQENGYRLFKVSTFSGANARGYLQPMMECNCIFASKINFDTIGRADTRFTLRGGGSINLHIYRSLINIPDTQFFVLPGEGSFHQYHGGVTTSHSTDREKELASFNSQLKSIWGNSGTIRRNPIMLGSIDANALNFLEQSAHTAQKRAARLGDDSQILWPDDYHQITSE
ncbi:hypothetical protein KFF03_01310 [Bacterioplanoides sp. SCSIO 12839]|nr:hypothetical protein KFF03_01310 [Bacterioplanoides sp. SCSIO 12839]